MNTTRTGKIARLPHQLREQLNRRLLDGEQGKKLLIWLNSLPDVHTILAADFGGRPINAQNLTEWKQGGHRDWLAEREARDLALRLAQEAVSEKTADSPPLSETVAQWVVGRYVLATQQVRKARGAEGWRLLREMCDDVSRLRRGDHSAQRLELRYQRTATIQARRARREKIQRLIHKHQPHPSTETPPPAPNSPHISEPPPPE